MYLASVRKVHETPVGRLDLVCPQIGEGHVLRNIEPLPLDGSFGVPVAGDRVLLVRMRATSKAFRWMPNRIMAAPEQATTERRVLYGPGGSPVVVLDAADGKVKLGGVDDLLAVARKTDATLVDSGTDSEFTNWMTAVDLAISVMAASFNAAIGVPVVGLGPGSVVSSVNPGSVVGKINQGSSVVEVV